MCDADYNLTFYVDGCEITRNGSRKVIGKGTRAPINFYILEEIQGEGFYLGQTIDCWSLHKRLRHLNFDNLVKIKKKTGVVRGISKL